MWQITFHGTAQHKEIEDLPGSAKLKKPVIALLKLTARQSISMGDAREIKGWNFGRDQPRKGPKLKPSKVTVLTEHDTSRCFKLKREAIYLVDSVDEEGTREFIFFALSKSEGAQVMTRTGVRDLFFESHGQAELVEALEARAWTRAWIIAQQAPESQRAVRIEECLDALRLALRATEEVPLEGRPKQISWAEPLRLKAMTLLRHTWRSLVAHPTLASTQPRQLYALMTCAWAFKTQPRAELFIAADFHITRGQIAELVDRFSALGKYHAGPSKSLAEPLSRDELATLQNLAPR